MIICDLVGRKSQKVRFLVLRLICFEWFEYLKRTNMPARGKTYNKTCVRKGGR